MEKEVISRVQTGEAGLEFREVPQFWSMANRKERRELVVAETMSLENECYKIKAVAQR